MVSDRDPVDAADALLTSLEADDDVAYAEVGAVDRRQRRARSASDREEPAIDVTTTGVWCRVFAGGSVGYRFTSVLSDEDLRDMADRAIRSAKTLAQDTPSSFDTGACHRAFHPGWSADRDGLGDREPLEELRAARDRLPDGARSRLSYQRDLLDVAVLTTAGSAVRTTLDRAAVDAAVDVDGGPRLRTHCGTTTGADVLGNLGPTVDRLGDALERYRRLPAATSTPTGPREVVFSPRAAGRLFEQLGAFFEADTAAAGAEPFEPGDRIAPASLTIDDVVRPGSWGAHAYDAAGRPTTPVRLVDDGVVAGFLHDVETAVDADATAAGSLLLPLGFEHAPRIRPRHLDVAAGDVSPTELRGGADIVVDRLAGSRFANEATNAKRISAAPAASLYAHNTRRLTPDAYDETSQTVRLDVAEAYTLEDGDRAASLDGVVLEFDVADLRSITGLGTVRETTTGTAKKHKATFPFAVTAPAVRLETTVTEGR